MTTTVATPKPGLAPKGIFDPSLPRHLLAPAPKAGIGQFGSIRFGLFFGQFLFHGSVFYKNLIFSCIFGYI